MVNQNCYICNNTDFSRVDGVVVDQPQLPILRCNNCGLVFLESFDHIDDVYYEDGDMWMGADSHGEESIVSWRNESFNDDNRRMKFLKNEIIGKDVMDFGAGAAGFLHLIRDISKSITAVEIDKKLHNMYMEDDIPFYSELKYIPSDIKFDVITSFHVIEHLKDPLSYIKELSKYLKSNGKLFLEFPNGDDALLTFYNSKEFSKFTYWGAHLMLFNGDNIQTLIEKANLKCNKVNQIQRYPLSNHLYWLANKKAGGHEKWIQFNTETMNSEYQRILGDMGKCDTILVEVTK